MNETQTLSLCLGSACHQRRGYDLLPVLEELLRRHGLSGQVELKGAFCLENCQRGCSLEFGGRVFGEVCAQNIEEIFDREILPRCPRH